MYVFVVFKQDRKTHLMQYLGVCESIASAKLKVVDNSLLSVKDEKEGKNLSLMAFKNMKVDKAFNLLGNIYMIDRKLLA